MRRMFRVYVSVRARKQLRSIDPQYIKRIK